MHRALTIALLSIAGLAGQQVWKPGEYALAQPAMKDPNAASRLEKLEAWKSQFPVTGFEVERESLYLTTYQALDRPADVFSVAGEILARDPGNLEALNALVVFIHRIPNPSATQLDMAERAATRLLAGTGGDKAQACLAWIAYQRKDWEKAEAECLKLVHMQPTNMQATYLLAQVIIRQKRVEKLPLSIYYLARAAHYRGPGELDEATRSQLRSYFEKQYKNYQGDASGINEFVAQAIARPFPGDLRLRSNGGDPIPPGTRLLPPDLGLWRSIREALTADGGQAYFDGYIKGALLPGGANGAQRLSGILVSSKPDDEPTELLLRMGDSKVAEVALKLSAPLRGPIQLGREISFEGVAVAFAREHFMLTFEVDRTRIAMPRCPGDPDASCDSDPQGALWKQLREALLENSAYWEDSVKGALIPGGAHDVYTLHGTLVSATSTELVLGMSDPKIPDVTLWLDSPLPGTMDPGGKIEFEGVASAFVREPFMLTFEVQKSKIVGWLPK